MALTKEMAEQDLKRLIGWYNESNKPFQKRYIKISIKFTRNLLKYLEKRGITEMPMVETVYLMNTKYRYLKWKLYKLERKTLRRFR